jgi:2-polyprenyl-6-methoxyphenol hydroxylase-like FAD-dependent oxidoreductase
VAAGYRWPQWSIHRGELFGVLQRSVVERLGRARFHPGHPITTSAQLVELSAGFDVVVGCDGVHSIARSMLVPDEGPPLWNGVTMWRGATVMAPFLDGRTMIMAGVVAHRMVVYPIRDLPAGRQLVNWVAEVRTDDGRPMPRQQWNREVDVAEPLAWFADFRFDWLDVPAMIAAADHVLAYPMVDRDPLATWRRGNTTLLGDAAHPMYPVGSNGASQAIIDARVLARELALGATVTDALDAYQRNRLPATAAVVRANRMAGPERCMEIVGELAPQGFQRLDDVISHAELEELATSYRSVAGFDPTVLNDRPSLDVP